MARVFSSGPQCLTPPPRSQPLWRGSPAQSYPFSVSGSPVCLFSSLLLPLCSLPASRGQLLTWGLYLQARCCSLLPEKLTKNPNMIIFLMNLNSSMFPCSLQDKAHTLSCGPKPLTAASSPTTTASPGPVAFQPHSPRLCRCCLLCLGCPPSLPDHAYSFLVSCSPRPATSPPSPPPSQALACLGSLCCSLSLLVPRACP